MRYRALLAVVAVYLSCLSIPSEGSELESEVVELRRQVALLSARLDELERSSSVVVREEAVAGAPSRTRSAGERIRFKGDFRYRHDYIDADGLSARNRHRIRARFGAFAEVRPGMEAGLQLASGPALPNTTNQTLGNAASTKDIRLDLAYLRWQLPVDGLSITGGKFKNPLERPSSLIWDSDINPEGIAVQYGEEDLFATAMGLWTVERSSEDDSFLLAAQLGWRHAFEEGPALKIGASFYNYTDLKGEQPLFDGIPRGNSVDGAGNYLFDFRQVELFSEIDLKGLGVPVSLFGQFVRNTEAGSKDRGYALGVDWAPLERWELAYNYRDVEADATLGIFTDSDFGVGATGARGHVFETSFDVTDAVAMKMTYLRSEADVGPDAEIDVDRVFLDFSFKY
jgi:hypothetical protein